MWEVVATKADGRVRTKVVVNWKQGMQLADRALNLGWKVSIIPYYVDFIVADEFGTLTKIAVRVTPRHAAKFAVQWAQKDRLQSGCMLWPHGLPIPKRFIAEKRR